MIARQVNNSNPWIDVSISNISKQLIAEASKTQGAASLEPARANLKRKLAGRKTLEAPRSIEAEKR